MKSMASGLHTDIWVCRQARLVKRSKNIIDLQDIEMSKILKYDSPDVSCKA
jgi:hypothetical protein